VCLGTSVRLRLMPRPSPVTDAVRSLIEGDGHRAWSLDELLEEVRKQIRTANFSTVLRAIWTLEKRSLVDRVDLGDGKARYEAPRDHHEHVRCIRCGSIAEVPGCVVDEAAAGVEARTGYAVQSHQVVFAGLCPSCRLVAAGSGR
jgi:Fur family transcriptional regulator, ferric uptake regulator